jgi:hypothetical protein
MRLQEICDNLILKYKFPNIITSFEEASIIILPMFEYEWPEIISNYYNYTAADYNK